MDRLHELLTGEHMPKDYYLYEQLLEHKMILEEFVPEEIIEYKKLLDGEL